MCESSIERVAYVLILHVQCTCGKAYRNSRHREHRNLYQLIATAVTILNSIFTRTLRAPLLNVHTHTHTHTHTHRKLAGTITFMILFLVVVFLQRDITMSFAIEDALLSKLQGSLPQESAGYFNSDNRGTGTLESASDWYEWMGGILDTLYLDATCGEAAVFCVITCRI
jgi:hypothetical protein